MTDILLKTVIGVLIFSMVVTIFASSYGDSAQVMGVSTADMGAFNQTLNKINETINLTREANRQMFSTEDQTGETTEQSLIKGSFSSLKIIWRSFDLARVMISELAIAFMIPAWIVSVFTTLLLISIVVAILLLIFRRT